MAQTQTRQRSSRARSRSAGSSRNGSRPRSRSTAERLKARANDAAGALGPIAQKSAKPAMAAGAALAGLAAGAALASRGRSRLGDVAAATAAPLITKEGATRTLLRATRELHATACTLNDVASEIRQVRELAQAGRSRSPIEVVLQGLTRRPEQ
ncbi:MAG TPA: hypothetical protein VFI18_01445 [Gaiellales bacterium]|nr:hypothetical protein [Gaiellales bacterium]